MVRVTLFGVVNYAKGIKEKDIEIYKPHLNEKIFVSRDRANVLNRLNARDRKYSYALSLYNYRQMKKKKRKREKNKTTR